MSYNLLMRLIDISLPRNSQFANINNWSLTGIVVAVINLIIVFSVIAFVFQIFLGGFKFILAGGDKERTQNATRGMKNAFIGILIVFGTYAIVNLMENFLGVPLLYFHILPVG